MKNKLKLWELLVPSHTNDGKKISKKTHQKWDNKVQELTGGLTVLNTVKGKWYCSQKNKTQNEEMIVVRIACDEETIHEVIELTIDFYDQKAVMAYLVSSHCIMLERVERKNVFDMNVADEYYWDNGEKRNSPLG